MFPGRAVALCGFALALAACASVLGIDDPIVDLTDAGADARGDATVDAGNDVTVDTGNDAAVDTGSDVGVDAGSDVRDGSSDAPTFDVAPDVEAGPCPTMMVDDTVGIFVDSSSSTNTSCGTRTVPCKTIQKGLDQAHQASGKTTVYVANGTYTEQIALYGGLTLQGGWNVVTPTWTATCARGDVTITAPITSNVTVRADALTTPATVAKVTITSKPQANVLAGETIYGVIATGTTTLHLVDVDIAVANGGDGSQGDAGADGATAMGDCPVGAGGTPSAGAVGSAADAGYFTDAGYVAVGGGPGVVGTRGDNGTAGSPGVCINCVSCGGTLCNASQNGMQCGQPGQPGCGGAPGTGGLGGTGGGSSIALFVFDATVDATRGSLTSGAGGAGGGGGTGGAGGSGSRGSQGATGMSCGVHCNGNTLNCQVDQTEAGAGGAGSLGGSGSAGGRGGGGAGGWSCSFVKAGNASVTLSSTTTATGSPGLGAAGAPNGTARSQCP